MVAVIGSSKPIPPEFSPGLETASEVPSGFALHPQSEEGVFSFPINLVHDVFALGRNVVADVINQATVLGHELIHGDYPEKFRQEFDQNRMELICDDGTKKTVRVFNQEFTKNDRPAIVYTFSLAVPGAHGVEIPTLADIVGIGEKTGQAVVAISSEGFSGKTNTGQKIQMRHFEKLVGHNFEVLRQVLPNGKNLTVTGASLGGMMAHAIAANAVAESEKSGHELKVTNIVSLASAGHESYNIVDLLLTGKQFIWDEPPAIARYINQGSGIKHKVQRVSELFGTAPRCLGHLGSAAIIGLGIIRSPLSGNEFRIPHTTNVVDIVHSDDFVTQPERRSELWKSSGHPNVKIIQLDGSHMDLLMAGREATVTALWEVAPPLLEQLDSVA